MFDFLPQNIHVLQCMINKGIVFSFRRAGALAGMKIVGQQFSLVTVALTVFLVSLITKELTMLSSF